MQDLLQELHGLREDLHKSMRLLRQNGEALAMCERDYQVKKAQTVIQMKAEGCTSTEIALTIKGQPEVSEALFKRDKAQVMYDANQEHINVTKLELRVLENQIRREWGDNGNI